MFRSLHGWGLALALLSMSLGGCYAYARPAPIAVSGGMVYSAPPPARAVVQPPAPYDGAVWVDGHWQWNGAQYVWAEGYYVAPRAGYVYASPRWEQRGGGYVYVQGGYRAAPAYRGSVVVQPSHRSYGRRYGGGVIVHQPSRGGVVVRQPSRGGVVVAPPRRGGVVVQPPARPRVHVHGQVRGSVQVQ